MLALLRMNIKTIVHNPELPQIHVSQKREKGATKSAEECR